MALSPGQRLGTYEVVALIGHGGMGEVYRARDTRLGREVALKILPEAFASDAERLARFEREAKTLASLNHPHIAHIYGMEGGRAEGGTSVPPNGAAKVAPSVLVMELVEGEDLAQRIGRGPIPIDEALPIARQIAEALEAAHAQGIIHRDLKPANVKVRPDNKVKVLDFGLAKALESSVARDFGPATAADSPTITSPAARLRQGYGGQATEAGMILGTAAYMSPEQARGRSVDARADIWAFGCVLYEMISGCRLFDGPSVTDTLAEVLKKDIDLATLPAETPPTVRRVLHRCLQRDPDRRFHSIADARIEIEDAASGNATAVAEPTIGRRRWWMSALALGIVAFAVGVATMWIGRAPATTDARLRAFTIAGAGFNFVGSAGISHNGKWIAYSPDAEAAPFRLFLRSVDSFEPREIGASNDTGLNPFFSPDGQWVAYFANNALYKVALSGGDPQLVAAMPGPETRHGAWGPDGTIVVSGGISPGTGLWKTAAADGALSRLTQPGPDEAHLSPEILPDGRRVLFTILTRQSVSVAAVALAGGAVQSVLSGARSPRYSSTGHLFFQRSNADDLMAVRFDPARLVVSGEPVRLTAVARINEVAAYAVADDGTLLYSAPGEIADWARYSLVVVDQDGKERVVLDEPASYAQPRVSPDGRLLLYRRIVTPLCDLWTLDLARGTRTRVTVEGDNHDPLWHPNGRDITWSSDLPAGFEVRLGPVDRSQPVRSLIKGAEARAPASWTHDGRLLAFASAAATPGGVTERPDGLSSDIYFFDAQSGATRPFLATRFSERQPAFSPDGHWIAWVSNEAGRDEVYIQRVAGEGRLQISTEGGHHPIWSRDGRELFYAEASRLMGVTLQLGAAPQASRPRVVVEGPYAWERFGNYDIMPDGSFVFVKRVGQVGDTANLRVILNWRQLATGL